MIQRDDTNCLLECSWMILEYKWNCCESARQSWEQAKDTGGEVAVVFSFLKVPLCALICCSWQWCIVYPKLVMRSVSSVLKLLMSWSLHSQGLSLVFPGAVWWGLPTASGEHRPQTGEITWAAAACPNPSHGCICREGSLFPPGKLDSSRIA